MKKRRTLCLMLLTHPWKSWRESPLSLIGRNDIDGNTSYFIGRNDVNGNASLLISCLTSRVRKGLPREATTIMKVLPLMLVDFFEGHEIMNKIIVEFLSNQQPQTQLFAKLLFQVQHILFFQPFNSCIAFIFMFLWALSIKRWLWDIIHWKFPYNND